MHHFALLIGYGASAINPYVAFETIDDMIREGMLPGLDHKKGCANFVKAASKGVVKVMSKMGISAIQSYRGAQVFEALGLRQDVIDQYFTWTPSRVGGNSIICGVTFEPGRARMRPLTMIVSLPSRPSWMMR